MAASTPARATQAFPAPISLDFTFHQKVWQGKVVAIQQVSTCNLPTDIPHVPVYIRGSISIAGWTAPVLDIHQYCGLPPQPLHTTHVAIVQFSDDNQDDLINAITNALSTTSPCEQETSPHTIDATLFMGTAEIDGQLVILMDASQLIRQGLLTNNNNLQHSHLTQADPCNSQHHKQQGAIS